MVLSSVATPIPLFPLNTPPALRLRLAAPPLVPCALCALLRGSGCWGDGVGRGAPASGSRPLLLCC
eukprot:scaffold80084_cov37-Tisochrysis_lutea.AAC.1